MRKDLTYKTVYTTNSIQSIIRSINLKEDVIKS